MNVPVGIWLRRFVQPPGGHAVGREEDGRMALQSFQDCRNMHSLGISCSLGGIGFRQS